jgi:hypothetical protein
MGFKNNTIEYGFGQMGSILITGNTNAVTSNDVDGVLKDGSAVFVAIQFLEDTVFDNAGLTSADNTIYINSSAGSTGIDANGGSSTDSVTFPKGLTIYGRWTSILLDSGKVIAYIGY